MGKVLQMASRSSVTISKDLYDEVYTVVKKATGIDPQIGKFAEDAIREKLEFYRKLAADQKGKKAKVN